MQRKVVTNLVVYKEGKILLGHKKRGFGQGKWNSFGGKAKEGEDIKESALRELKEEAGITATAIEKKGFLVFEYPEDGTVMESHIFGITAFSGDPEESEEMAHAWFEFGDIPYDKMWPDDAYWLPLLLEGKSFEGRFAFEDGRISEYELYQKMTPNS